MVYMHPDSSTVTFCISRRIKGRRSNPESNTVAKRRCVVRTAAMISGKPLPAPLRSTLFQTTHRGTVSGESASEITSNNLSQSQRWHSHFVQHSHRELNDPIYAKYLFLDTSLTPRAILPMYIIPDCAAFIEMPREILSVGAAFLTLFIVQDCSKIIVEMLFKSFAVVYFLLSLYVTAYPVTEADAAFESYIKVKGSKQGQRREDTHLIERGAEPDGT
jgi:hypothetical protein